MGGRERWDRKGEEKRGLLLLWWSTQENKKASRVGGMGVR